jgi:CheY-like chemotaxis protein
MTNEPVANILIVDDDKKTLVAMEALLSGPGRKIVQAESGREALRCLLREDFVLVLLDVRLPDMDGFETAALMRRAPPLCPDHFSLRHRYFGRRRVQRGGERSRRLLVQTSCPSSTAG